MIYKQCPLCSQPWFSFSKTAGLVKIEPEKLDQDSIGSCVCNSCGMGYDITNNSEKLSNYIGDFEVEWNLLTMETKVMVVKNYTATSNLYIIPGLLPLDISEQRLQILLTFS